LCPLQHNRIKAYYDRVHVINNGSSSAKEKTKLLKLWSKRQFSGKILYESGTQAIANNPLSLYIIPYDTHGTLIRDIIAS
jgi:hypothetical protein